MQFENQRSGSFDISACRKTELFRFLPMMGAGYFPAYTAVMAFMVM